MDVARKTKKQDSFGTSCGCAWRLRSSWGLSLSRTTFHGTKIWLIGLMPFEKPGLFQDRWRNMHDLRLWGNRAAHQQDGEPLPRRQEHDKGKKRLMKAKESEGCTLFNRF